MHSLGCFTLLECMCYFTYLCLLAVFYLFQLSQGTLLAVSPSLIVQDKQRMHDLPCGARVVFGANGYVYITPTVPQEQASTYIVNFEEVTPITGKLTCLVSR